ncbi:GNAT family N-acetyltransferase [Marinomonas mediterranea]|jgi:hypothetical protein|uniref:Histone acetyltransferase HPA2-like acetyltransferase n=1 Tax=Marinomonas mediterranea (strain ATCC 700492 / JCM 21426 / NBRC 103028 / MMB-1) TaxID=717774 RepID=F2JUU2_MARM1|nr:GNAT family N-acetyltransferase [Marinomonas mediterranea]ADZ90507.1 histone acetyltransferase HPA2-like acetyltransferase [Marinomonas mediterranea MMB-1]WCN08560.1 GNAT family N-acetyltransferase [Marinomonas mediterranea]WCN12614.1 GNAT family N-acetyltransferase [Marinomonas mediterranea]WCN16686.1 GNAT family N-acetyltransferase [Marinomonas mediterranea MMB-1]
MQTYYVEKLTTSRLKADQGVIKELQDIFFRSVHGIPDLIYTPEQKAAWAPAGLSVLEWRNRLQNHTIWLARSELTGSCLGFIELDESSDIDLLYVCPLNQKLGIANELFDQAQYWVKNQYSTKSHWYVQSSDIAYEFFLRRGFIPHKRNQVDRGGILLENTTMRKALS